MAITSLARSIQSQSFLYSQNDYLTPELSNLLGNSLIQPQFNYAFVFPQQIFLVFQTSSRRLQDVF